MDEPEYQRPDGFDLDGAFTQDEPDVVSALDALGVEDWRDVIANSEFLDGSEVRPGIYFSAWDALAEAYEIGILEFVTLWWDGEHWHIVVNYDEPA